MSRLRNVPETCPIYDEAIELKELLVEELHSILNPNVTDRILEYLNDILSCTDRCREVAGELRGMCGERVERISPNLILLWNLLLIAKNIKL